MFEIKPYTRKELALLYFPNQSNQCASRYLKQLILGREGTEKLIEQIGLRRILTKQEVAKIVELLGEP